jgi:hypothetical protein
MNHLITTSGPRLIICGSTQTSKTISEGIGLFTLDDFFDNPIASTIVTVRSDNIQLHLKSQQEETSGALVKKLNTYPVVVDAVKITPSFVKARDEISPASSIENVSLTNLKVFRNHES